MNILITGGAGFIGSNIADKYIENGHKVVVVDDLYTGREKNVPEKATFLNMDIRDENLMTVFLEHDINFVNHQAARGDVRASILHPQEYADVNIKGGINLLECAKKVNAKGFVYSSTGGCVYGEPQYFPSDEKHPINPVDPYGASKASFEIYVRAYNYLYGLPFTIFRYPNVYGPRQDPYGEAGVISIFAKAMLQNKDVIINGTGEQRRDFVFVEDVVSANIMVTNNNSNTVFNLSAGEETSILSIFNKMKEIIKYKQDPIFGPAKEGEVMRSYLSSNKFESEFSWKRRTNIDDGLKATIDYISQHE